ncbi:MAG: efflux RND transporter periplasmic adaptor subunit [Candidatus Falkowbacteria bacterium]|nr:efflux RND transporter periplasmic adaptor subunit [Candidatus Falkowbacteria bacterium]
MFWQTILKRKKLIIFIVIVLAAGGYYFYTTQQAKKTSTSYTTAAVENGTISVTITGSGQVSELNKVDLKPMGSGALVQLNVKNGDLVKADQVIAVLDQRNNQNSLRQASASLSSAQANFNKVVAGATSYDIKASQDSLTQAQNSYQNVLTQLDNTTKSATETLNQAQKTLDDLQSFTNPISSSNKRDVVLNTIEDKISSAQSALDSENKILNDSDLKPTLSVKDSSSLNTMRQAYSDAVSYVSTAQSSLSTAKAYKSDVNIESSVNNSITLFNKTLRSLQACFLVMQATVPNNNVTQSQIDSYKNNASSQASGMSTAINSVQSASQSLKDAIVAAQNNLVLTRLSTSQQISSAKAQVDSSAIALQTAKNNLAKIKAPAVSSDIQSARSQVISAEAQVQNAQEAISNNIIKAPFEGQIAALTVQKGDQLSASTVIASLITQQKIAIVPLNETDVAKVRTGQQVILTFDALPDLTLTGKVGEIDILGTVAQGVVTYNVKIVFDTNNDAIKSGMSVNASIIIASKTDILMVPNSAMKSDNNGSYVQSLDAQGQPQRKDVEVGLANDTSTEITSGLSEGDQVVTQTVTSGTSAATTNSSSSSIRIPGLTGGAAAGGGFRGN